MYSNNPNSQLWRATKSSNFVVKNSQFDENGFIYKKDEKKDEKETLLMGGNLIIKTRN
jgi:hypothetical protein